MNRERFLKLYREIIAINSSSSEKPEEDVSNEKVIDLLISWLTPLGFSAAKIPVPGTRNKFNLIAKYGAGSGGLAFSGHTDTVPANTDLWSSSPFQTEIRNNRLYGLGVIDMKGFFVFVMETLLSLDLTKLQKPVWVLATADEETTMNGAIHLAQHLGAAPEKPDMIIIGEPTSMVPVVMHKGQLVQVIKCSGIGGHASNPGKGLSAVKILHRCMTELYRLEEKLREYAREELFEVPCPTLNIGEIKGGDAPNKIADHAELVFEVRLMPEADSHIIRKLTREALAPVLAEYPGRITLEDAYPPTEAFAGKIPEAMRNLLREVSEREPVAVNYATEATYFQDVAATAVMGPGSIDMAHQPDEYLDLSEAEHDLETLRSLLLKTVF